MESNVQAIWDDLLTDRDRAVIEQAGYAEGGAASWDSRSLGKRPALLLIDMQVIQLGPNLPILQAVTHYRQAMGRVGWQAVPNVARLLAAVRAARLPVYHTRVIPRGYGADDPEVAIIDAVAPKSGEVVLDKSYSSAFYGTDLRTRLVWQQVDTVIVAGNSTSGCVRATAVDARQHGFRVAVPAEATFDRITASHKSALLDLWMKYAAVLTLEETMTYIAATGSEESRSED